MPHKKLLNLCECGEEAYVVLLPKVGKANEYYVKCRSCEKRTKRCSTRDEARALWNGEEFTPMEASVEPAPSKGAVAVMRRVRVAPDLLQDDTFQKIAEMLDNLEHLLKAKNLRYGNSALAPVGVFFKGQVENALLVRIDDKVSRIRNSVDPRKNDVVDLVGYLVLLCVAKGWTDFAELID